uniref:Uncharacterized protein n=1 Tax=Pseudomonas phage JS TaxID=3015289 RepID=A0AAT9TSQ3_9VIRU
MNLLTIFETYDCRVRFVTITGVFVKSQIVRSLGQAQEIVSFLCDPADTGIRLSFFDEEEGCESILCRFNYKGEIIK